MTSMYTTIEKKLKSAFAPEFLDVIDESHMHGGGTLHETHYKVVIATEKFEGMRLLQRHRAINEVLSEELRSTVHALALHTYTPAEWEKKSQIAPQSPNCRGGSKMDPLF